MSSVDVPTESVANDPSMEKALAELEKTLRARGGESMTMERALRHVVTRVTDEGLVIEIFDLDDARLFGVDSDVPEPILADVAALLSEVLNLASNAVAVQGHVRSYPITLIRNPAWALSAARAQAIRGLLEETGLRPQRIERVAGFADRKPATANPTTERNNRLEIILLRRNR